LFADVLTFAASPNSGYRFDQWLINGVSNNANPFNLTVTENVTILPVFSLVPIQSLEPEVPPSSNQTIATPTNQSSIPSPVNTLAISILSPAGGEKWQTGTTHNVEWNVSGNAGLFNVTLEYSTAGFDGPWTTIGSNITFNGQLVWTVPSTPATYYIRAVTVDSGDPAHVALATSLVEISETATPEASNTFVVPLIIVLVTLVPGVLVPVVRNSEAGNRRGGKQIPARAH
jgi:hypothetical protein